MIGRGHFNFTGVLRNKEYYFSRGGTSVPFPGLSDGYRGFIGWVGDLLYHLLCLPYRQEVKRFERDRHGR